MTTAKLNVFVLLSLLFCLSAAPAAAQIETLTNALVAEMSRAGLDKQIILKKINDSTNNFDVSVSGLIELKKAAVADEVIALMLEKTVVKTLPESNAKSTDEPKNYSESEPAVAVGQFDRTVPAAKEALARAKTIAIVKSSLNPSRQGLEKALFKRADWRKYNLTIIRYKEEADLYIEIGRIPLSWITHRYVFRLYDRRSGAVLTAGETTSWGSLAENLAREITQKMNSLAGI